MANIPNTEYITVNKDGIFVGGKPATKYRGESIWSIEFVKDVFAWMQEQKPQIEEFHIGAFETRGEYAKVGNPSGNYGPNAWCRVKYKNGNLGAWVFGYTHSSAARCAINCAAGCADGVRSRASFRSAVFGFIEKTNANLTPTQNALKNSLKDTDLSQFIGTHTIGAYEIVVRNKQNIRG